MNHLRFLSAGIVLFSCIAFSASAQDFTDALRYSYLQPQGTARSIGFGNALGSIGGDFATLGVNPAGIGIYRSSELEFTPSLKINSVDGSYLGNTQSANNTRFNFSSLGFVSTNAKKGKRYDKSKWKAVSFGFGFNRLADFNRDYQYNGNNKGANSSTAADAFEYDANTNPGNISTPGTNAYLGYNSFLVNYDATLANPRYASVVPYQQGLNQSRLVSERGGLNELELTLGGNYMEKLLIGATIGIPFLNYDRTTTYTETALTANPVFSNFVYNDELSTTGTGINLKIGAIYKITEAFRVGAAVHSPTYFSMHDSYTNQISSNTDSGSVTVNPNTNVYDYSIVTPWRGILSASYIIGKYGFITADYEYVDYPMVHINFNGADAVYQTQANNQIKNTLQAASNFRIGAEARITNIFMLRAGFGYYGNPYQNSGVDGSSIVISGGIGFRFPHWFIDAALAHTQMNSTEQPYADPYTDVVVPTATLKNSLNNAVLTLGFKY